MDVELILNYLMFTDTCINLLCSREASDAGEFHLKTKSRDFRVIFDEK
jgi:hypothetical protein